MVFLLRPTVELKVVKVYSGPGHTVKAIVSPGAQGLQALDLECRHAPTFSTCFSGNCRAMLDGRLPGVIYPLVTCLARNPTPGLVRVTPATRSSLFLISVLVRSASP